MLIVLVLTALAICYYLFDYNYKYWQRKGVQGPKPVFLLGNLSKTFTFKENVGEIYEDFYKQYPDEELVGIYKMTTPTLLIRSPELIKEMLVKSFSHFHDNDIHVDNKKDPIFGRSPFVLKGSEWKTVRGQLTPAFTSGKMKWLYPLLEDVSKNFVKFVDSHPEMSNGYEAKELCSRFTLNNVASCAFGLEGRCFEEEKSMFRQLAEETLSPESFQIFLIFLMMFVPQMSKVFTPRFMSKKAEKILMNLISETLEYRKENKIVRNDFLQLLIQLKENCKDYEFTDVDVTAHAAGFLGDGFETSSIVMSFTLFELAANSEVQTKLRKQVSEAFEKNNGYLPYDALYSLDYLDAIINESLRRHPPVFTLMKLCTKSFTFTLKNSNKSIVIDEKTPIVIPISALHNDPNYYEDPKTFKPERFLPENKENITKYAFLPFGEGPRACLGQKFALLQIKAGIAHLIKDYELSVNQKTQLPIKYQPRHFFAYPVGGLWLNFKKIAKA